MMSRSYVKSFAILVAFCFRCFARKAEGSEVRTTLFCSLKVQIVLHDTRATTVLKYRVIIIYLLFGFKTSLVPNVVLVIK